MFKVVFYTIFLVFISGCASKSYIISSPSTYGNMKKSKAMYKSTMRPYKVNGVWYYPHPVKIGDVFVGKASWYGPSFHGGLTSSGERYNMYSYTAASKTLPMNTFVKVTNLDNGKSTIVRINDRGPFVNGRIIDLSYKAAEEIGLVKHGVCNVKLEVVDCDAMANRYASKPPKKERKFLSFINKNSKNNKYFVQIASLYNRQRAIDLKLRYKYFSDKYRPYLIARNNQYKLLIGRFKSKEEAKAFIKEKNLNNAFILKE